MNIHFQSYRTQCNHAEMSVSPSSVLKASVHESFVSYSITCLYQMKLSEVFVCWCFVLH